MTNLPPGSPAPPVREDPAAPDPTGPNRWRTPLVWGGLLLALVLVVAAVGLLGGFDRRRDQLTPTPAGQTFTAGPYELSFTEATVQYSTDSKIFEVVAVGTARTTADQTMTPPVAGGAFSYAQNLLTREVQPVDSYGFGDSTDIGLRARGLTPGLPPVRLTAEFEFAAEPGDTLRLVVFDQEFADTSVFGDQDPTWSPVSTGHDVRLPLTALPDRQF